MSAPHEHPLARTVAEEHLYLDLHPCRCGSNRAQWSSAVIDADGTLLIRRTATCPQCQAEREMVFRLPDATPDVPASTVYFGDGRSELLDPGEWLFVADRYAQAVPAQLPSDADERAVAYRRISTAYEAITQALAFVDEQTGVIASEALTSADSAQLLTDDPGRLDPGRLTAVQQVYRELMEQYAG